MDTSGRLYTAGNSENGQLGVHPSAFMPTNREPYVNITQFGVRNPVMRVRAGGGMSFVINKEGTLYSCGKSDHGRLALGSHVGE